MSGEHQADLDGNCERCGLAIGFSGVHTDRDCIDALIVAVSQLEEEREQPIHLVLSHIYEPDKIAVSAFGSKEDAEAELGRLNQQHVPAMSIHVARRPTGLHQPPAHGPKR